MDVIVTYYCMRCGGSGDTLRVVVAHYYTDIHGQTTTANQGGNDNTLWVMVTH